MERLEASNLFASQEAEEQVKKESVKPSVPVEAPAEEPKEEQAPKPVAPTPEQIIAIKAAIVNSQTLEEVARLEQAAIVNSQTLEEVARLEQALKSGQLPANLNIGDYDVAAKKEDAKVDKTVTNGDDKANKEEENVPEQKTDGPTDMEQE